MIKGSDIMSDYMAYVWIGIAVVMAIYEMATTQLVTVWFVIGAVCAALTTLATGDIVIQIVVFVAVSVIALLATRPLVNKFRRNNIKTSTNADRLRGEIGVMNSDLSQPEDVGQAKVLGGIWSAKTNDPPLKKGDKVKVLAIEGVKLIVEKTE